MSERSAERERKVWSEELAAQLLEVRAFLEKVEGLERERDLAVGALEEIIGGGECWCDDHEGAECCVAVEYWCPECIAGKALGRMKALL